MTVTLNLPPDLEAGFLAQARTHGLPLEDYLVEHVLREAAKTTKPEQGRKRHAELKAIHRLRNFGKHGLSLGPGLTVKDLINEGRR